MEDDKLFTQEELDRVIGDRLAREKSRYDELQAKYTSLTNEHLDALNKMKLVDEQLQELPKLKREAILNKVARDKKLPEFLVGRLSGETEEDIAKDADTLLAELDKNDYKGLGKTPGETGSVKKEGLSLIRDNIKVM